ncbi:pali-domain-containing protein [Astrocystis sublimbata]|nr:pali-domain-containing protein [Astrocystis sublimbata]
MLRPATPLAILLFVAFALLLLSVLSTPIIKAIPLGVYNSDSGVVHFGVFGYCKGDQCSPIEIGYDTSIFVTSSSSSFDLPTAARSRLSAILIVHPVAALLTLIMFIMAAVAHLHSPSHSSRYLCGLFIFGIITFLVCLLAFLVDVLLFVPHLAWGSWLVLAATILVFLSFIVSCAMRRTLVGRKARKKRIAENPEMSGENYYNRQAHQEVAPVGAASLQPTVPSVSGGNGPSDKAPSYMTYERRDDRSSDERIPLTARTPSERSPNNAPLDPGNAPDMPNNRRSVSMSGSMQTIPTDPYGNPMPQPPDAYGIRRGPSMERMDMRGGRGGPQGSFRGRGGNGRGMYGGGYGPPNGRGGYGGPPNGRGGYGPAGRGGYGPGPNGRGGFGPRGGYNGGMRGGRTPPPGYAGAPYDGRSPPPPPPPGGFVGYGPGRQGPSAPRRGPYDDNPSMPSVSTNTTNPGGYQPYRPGDANGTNDTNDDLPRAESPPPLPGTDLPEPGPVGQAVEMDATSGLPSPARSPAGFGQFDNHIRDSDTDVAGMLALQEGRMPPAQQENSTHEQNKYLQNEPYVPPRQAWNQGPGRNSPGAPPQRPSPGSQEANDKPRSPPLPAANGGTYYEDVDPRFSEPSPRAQQAMQEASGGFDDPHLGAGARSPTISERSGFTSVSQRGINPRWNPNPPFSQGGYSQQMPSRKPVNRNEVNILNSNPDFQLPGRRGGGPGNPPRGGPRGGGMIPGSAYPGGV